MRLATWARVGHHSHMSLMGHATISFRLRAEEPWTGPAFEGSMLRGAFGHALRRLVCVMRRPVCAGCPLAHGCIYMRIFETPAPEGAPAGLSRPPHPFVIDAMLHPGRGPRSEIGFAMRLFGRALEDAPFVARAVVEAAARGLGPQRQPMQVASPAPDGVVRLAPQEAPAPIPELVRMRLETPLRLRLNGRAVDAGGITGPVLGQAIVRRVGLMAAFHGRPLQKLPELRAQAERVALRAADLSWRRLTRRSARQGRRQAIGGVVGSLVVDLSQAPGIRDLARWLPLTHLGKGASMGLGKVALEAA